MYAEFFGFDRRPFKVNPAGPEVFVGPQTARLMKGFASAFESADAVITVTGAPGLGKSTLVRRALETLKDSVTVLELPRVKLSHDEVLEFLLEKLDAGDAPLGTIRRVLHCRERISAMAREGKPLCILIEDADRIGADALIELEALTSALSDDDCGGRMVLLGGQKLLKLLQSQPLARIAQRTRLRFPVQALNASELRGYLKHSLRLAGAEFDTIFEAGTDEAFHLLSGGTPRLTNNLVDSVLNVAAERHLERVGTALIAEVAREEYGIDLELPVSTQPEADALPSAEPGCSDDTDNDEDKQSNTVTAEELVLDEEAVKALQASDPVINSPLPDLDDLLPALEETANDKVAIAAEPPEAENEAAPADPSPTDTAIPTLFSSARMPAPASGNPEPEDHGIEDDGNDLPAWEQDPTLAELRPDLEALELALADSGGDPEPETKVVEIDDDPVIELKDPTVRDLPEITLDIAIQQKIDEATEALQKHDATIAEEEIEDAPVAPAKDVSATAPESVSEPESETEKARKSEMQAVANGIANARSLEDVDDKMAETLFGEEFSAIAAQVAANAPPLCDDEAEDAPIEMALVPEPPAEAAERPTIVEITESTESAMEREFKQVYGEDALEVSLQAEPQRGGLDLSASQRLATVRALNAEKKSATGKFATNGTNAAARATPAPTQTIEEQINTSMTQTLKTLSARPPSANDEDDDDDENKRGFFSRFRRT